MELQNLVKIKVHVLDNDADPIEVTVAASDENKASAEAVFTRVCDQLGLEKAHREWFSLFHGSSHPTCRYRLSSSIPLPATELTLQKWCFSPKAEQSMMKKNSVAAHLVFLQARHSVSLGKFQIPADVSQKLDEFVEDKNFPQELQYVSLCQTLPHYFSVVVDNCRLDEAFSTPQCQFPQGSLCRVYVCKYGLKLLHGGDQACVTWYQVRGWTLDRGAGLFTLTLSHVDDWDPVSLVLATPQSQLLLSACIEVIGLLQASEEDAPSFYTSMICLTEQRSSWENGLYDPQRACAVLQALEEGTP